MNAPQSLHFELELLDDLRAQITLEENYYMSWDLSSTLWDLKVSTICLALPVQTKFLMLFRVLYFCLLRLEFHKKMALGILRER